MTHDDQGAILDPGTEVAPGYEIVGHLRRGRRLDVYDVWSAERGCRCIAKVLAPDRIDDRDAAAKLRAEGLGLLALSHPNLVRAYELIDDPAATPVLILETLTGRTLGHLIDEFDEGLDAVDVAWLGQHLCSAAGYLHRHGILHLDIKPDNVICEDGRARLIDLSIAGGEGPTREGAGTYDYLAPEQARGEHVSPATDAWGIGITLFEALTGTVPFEPDDDGEGLTTTHSTSAGEDGDAEPHPQAHEPAPSVAERRAGLDPGLVAAVDACLVADPAARSGVAELATALARVAGADLRSASTPP